MFSAFPTCTSYNAMVGMLHERKACALIKRHIFFSVIFTILFIRSTQANRSIITSTKILKAFPMCCDKVKGYLKVIYFLLGKTLEPPSSVIKICNCGCEQNKRLYLVFD